MSRVVRDLNSLRNIRTMSSSKKRTIPHVHGQNSAYLDLYTLSKEKNRLKKEFEIIEKRKTWIQKRIDDINTEMNKLDVIENSALCSGELLKTGRVGANSGSILEKSWKVMPLKY